MFAIFSPPSTLFFFMRLAHLTDDCCVRYGGKSETAHQIATESSRMYEIKKKKKKVDGLECALLQVQRLPHIKTLVRRHHPHKKHNPTAPHQILQKDFPEPEPCSPFDGAPPRRQRGSGRDYQSTKGSTDTQLEAKTLAVANQMIMIKIKETN